MVILPPDTQTYMSFIDLLFDLLSDDKLDLVDMMFDVNSLNIIPADFIVGLLRLTYMYKDKLPSWNDYLEAAYIELLNRNIDPELELVGLLYERE